MEFGSRCSTSLLRRHFHHWREKLAEQRYMQVFSNTTQDSRDTDAFTLQHNQLVMFCFFVYFFYRNWSVVQTFGL